MRILIYWFRNDLRLADNPAFTQACLSADHLLPVYVHDPKEQEIVYGFERQGPHRQAFLRASLDDLGVQLRAQGSDLLEFSGKSVEVLLRLFKDHAADAIYCEQIEAPEEIEQVRMLQEQGADVKEFWQSSMLDPQTLPFELEKMPDVFTAFRREVEKARLKFAQPIDAPKKIPPLPATLPQGSVLPSTAQSVSHSYLLGGASHARAHLKQYLERRLPDSYKETRNQLIGMDYSSKFSAWLALGCISAREIAAQLNDYESYHGANDGTYWLWFELLWRDNFRFLHLQHGKQLYAARGLSALPRPSHFPKDFQRWCDGQTGEPIVDAGMRELAATGFTSNRMRQIVASFLVHDLSCDWRAGAAWFESQLVDFDVQSNQGNWLYVSGRGTDPRVGRRFNPAKQTQDHDPQGRYRQVWLA